MADFPITATGKPQKSAMREQMIRELEGRPGEGGVVVAWMEREARNQRKCPVAVARIGHAQKTGRGMAMAHYEAMIVDAKICARGRAATAARR